MTQGTESLPPIVSPAERQENRLHNYLQIMEAAGYVIFTANHAGYFTDVSPSVVRLTGYRPDEIIGKHFTELIDPEWRAQVAAFYAAQSRQGIYETGFEFPIITRSGQIKWVEQTVALLEGGGEDEIQAIVHDITERKWAQEAQWQLAELIEHSADFIGMADPEGHIIYLNQAAQVMVGLDNLGNTRQWTMYDFIAPPDEALFAGEVVSTIQKGGHWDGELHYRNFVTGASIPIQASIFAIRHPQTDAFLAYATISRDITEMKRAEEKLAEERKLLHLLMDNVPDIIYFKDTQSRFTRINRAHANFFGLKLPEDVMGKTDFDYMPTALAQELFVEEQEMLRSGKPVLNRAEYYPQEEDQPERWIVSNKVPLYDSSGQIVGLVGVSRDVTQQRQAEAALRASEARYRAIVEDQTEMVVRFKLDGTVVFANEAFCRYFAMSRETLTGMAFIAALSPDDQGLVIEKMAALNKDTPVFTMEFEYKQPDGRVTWQQWTGRAILGDDDEVSEFQAVGRDITERKQAEAALMASERHNRALLEAIPDLFMVLARDGTVIDIKADIERGWRKPRHQMVNRNLRDVGPKGQIEALLDYLEQTFTTRTVHTFNYRVDTPEGDVYYSARAVALNDQEALVLIRNVTDMKLAEQELSERVEQLEALRRVDMELADKLDVTYVLNMALDATMRLSGADIGGIGLVDESQQLHVARSIGKYDPAAVDAKIQEGRGIIARVMRQQKPELIEDVTSDPDYLAAIPGMVAQMTFPLMSQERMVGVLSVETAQPGYFTRQIFDFLTLLTSRVAASVENAMLHHKTETQLAELQALYNRVSKLEQLKTDMIRIASHDLRNPLATIFGYIELLRMDIEGRVEPDAYTHMDSIDQAAQRMMKMVSGILSLERIEEMLQKSTEEVFDLGKKAQAAFQENLPQAGLKMLQMRLENPTEAVLVEADPLQIEQAIANLIGNAIKYTPQGGAVTVRLCSDGALARFEVEDTGYGVPEAQQVRLFQPFFRAKSSDTKEIEGVGLGLHLVKSIVERYGGQIVFKSVQGQGSTFGFTLPLVKAPTERVS